MALDPSSPDQSPKAPLKGGDPSRRSYVELYRFALLLTGKEAIAKEAVREALAAAATEFVQLRNKNSRSSWLARAVRECSLKAVEAANAAPPAPESAPAAPGLAAKVAALPEPDRSALALFYCIDAEPGDLAELIGLRESKFAEALAKARQALAPESAFPEDELLRVHRPWGGDDAAVAKAVRAAAKKPDLQAKLTAQADFDSQCHAEVEQDQLPAGLVLPEFIEAPAPGWRTVLRQPAVLSIAIAVLVVLGVVIYMVLHKLDDFPGKDVVSELVEDSDDVNGMDFEDVPGTEAGKMSDWFLLKGYEDFTVPPELARAQVVGARVFQHEGNPVAQLELRERSALVFVVRGAEMKIKLNTPAWHIFQQDEWAVAARGDGENCYIVAFQGDCDDMGEYLHTVGK